MYNTIGIRLPDAWRVLTFYIFLLSTSSKAWVMNIFGHQAQIKAKKANSFGWVLVNPSRTQIGMLVNQIIFSKMFLFVVAVNNFQKRIQLIKKIKLILLQVWRRRTRTLPRNVGSRRQRLRMERHPLFF